MDSGPKQSGAGALIGRTVAGKFRIEALVGRGSMGFVYKATQINLNKTVAIKVLNPMHPDDGAFVHRFKREAKAASRLDHPNSLRVIDFGEDGDLLFIAMEFLQGSDLLEVLRRDYPLPRERIVRILSQALAALAVAHEMGVIHRDLKPENIMLLPAKDDEGGAIELVKVCDFGIAKLVEPKADGGLSDRASDRTGSGTLTVNGTLIGTPEYMSPEQARGEAADARSDIYSLGVILYQLLTGRLPFVAASKIRLVIKHVEERPMPPSSIESKVDLGLEAICLKALEKRPDDRFQSAREMRVALKASLQGEESLRKKAFSSAPPPPMIEAAPSAAPARPSSHPSSGRQKRADLMIAGTSSAPDDPIESAAALIEVRKILSSSPPPPRRSEPPGTAPAAMAPRPVAAAPPRAGPPVLLVAGVVALIAAIVYAALH